MSDVKIIEISPNEDGQRIDNFLIRCLKSVPKSHIYRLIRQGEIRVNKKRIKPHMKLQVGDLLRLPPIRYESPKQTCVTDDLKHFLLSQILFEDERLLVVNKPSGLAVHGGSGLSLGLIEALRAIRPDIRYLELAHRLDRETSGCIILTKKRSFLRQLNELFSTRKVHKCYWALLDNPWSYSGSNQTVNVPLLKNSLASGERMVLVSDQGKQASTRISMMENYEHACLVKAYPKTGRTHQIRVHCQYLDHSIIGDKKYGDDSVMLQYGLKKRLYLHARAIQFTLDDQLYSYEAPLDDAFQSAMASLREGIIS